MEQLLQRILKGVDLSSPGASAQILHNLLALMPWTFLWWFTAISLVIGMAIGWWRGRLWTSLWVTLLIGPMGWIVLIAMPSRRKAQDKDTGDTASR